MTDALLSKNSKKLPFSTIIFTVTSLHTLRVSRWGLSFIKSSLSSTTCIIQVTALNWSPSTSRGSVLILDLPLFFAVWHSLRSPQQKKTFTHHSFIAPCCYCLRSLVFIEERMSIVPPYSVTREKLVSYMQKIIYIRFSRRITTLYPHHTCLSKFIFRVNFIIKRTILLVQIAFWYQQHLWLMLPLSPSKGICIANVRVTQNILQQNLHRLTLEPYLHQFNRKDSTPISCKKNRFATLCNRFFLRVHSSPSEPSSYKVQRLNAIPSVRFAQGSLRMSISISSTAARIFPVHKRQSERLLTQSTVKEESASNPSVGESKSFHDGYPGGEGASVLLNDMELWTAAVISSCSCTAPRKCFAADS